MLDVLRASTTIVTALAHGAARVRPVRTLEEARAAASRHTALLGGERGGNRIDGFDLGNSPLEYTPERIRGRAIVITTTNGTAALHACRDAVEVLIGAIVNRSAVATQARLLAEEHGDCDIHLVCAGTDGEVTAEDLLGAGAILDAAAALPDAVDDSLDGAARAARDRYRATVAGGDAAAMLCRALPATIGGRNLVAIGMQADLPAAAAIDSFVVVPRLDRATGWLVAGMSGG